MSASNASYSQPTANSSDAPHMPSTSNEQLGRIRNTINDQSATSLTRLKDRFPYSRPDFLQLTTDEIKASADHSMRPIIMPRNMHILPWSSGYAECTNAGKSLWNEDQAAFCRKILKHPSNLLPDLPYTYFGIFDGHAGFGAALAAARHFDNILHEKLMEGVDLLIPQICHPYEPFKCPGDGTCISIQYLCDGAPDCSDGYDEDMRLCTAAKRPPVEETASFLQSLLASHGPNYLEKLFGSKARDALSPLGGVEKVAIALSESQTIEDFGAALHLMRSDLEHLRSVFMAVENGDLGMLKSLGIKDSELGDVKFFLEKLVNTGFLD